MDRLTFDTLRKANTERQEEWGLGLGMLDLSFRGNELAGEVGEACNIIKKLERERLGYRGSRATVSDLALELADVILCADLIALDAGIDLGAAVAAKFNATSEKVGLKTRLKEEPMGNVKDDIYKIWEPQDRVPADPYAYWKHPREYPGDMPEPTEADFADPEWNAVWACVMSWNVNVPRYYSGHCAATGSHVQMIMEAIRAARRERPEPPTR